MVDSNLLAEAKRLLGRDNERALAAARTAHASRPTPEAVLLLATALRRTGDPARAAALLEPLATLVPHAWGVQHELGLARAAAGDEAGGMAAIERAVALNPKASGPRLALRDLRMVGGAASDEMAALEDPALQGAVLALLDGDHGAREALLQGFGLDPDDAATACLIAELGIRFDRAPAVIPLLQHALAMAPGYRPARFRLAEALHRTEYDDEALATLRPLSDDDPSAIVRSLRGAILMRLGREETALPDLAAAAEGAPALAGPRLILGHALRVLGKSDEAIAAYRGALDLDPNQGEAWWSIADLKTARFDGDDRSAMERLAENTALPVLSRSQAGFALGRALEDAGDHEAAFDRYIVANALRRSIEPYDATAHQRFVREMIEVTDQAFFAARAGFGHPDAGPIFVVGMPRSGSTLIEQILASHSQVEGLSELPDITNLARGIDDYPAGLAGLSRDTLRDLGARYLDRTRSRRRTSARHAIDKFPGNAFHAALIHLILPNARIIDVRRDPRDCCVSLFSQSFAAGQAYSYDLRDLGHHYARYEALMSHVDRALPGRILRVSYESLVDDLEGETRRMLDHCGLDFEPATLRFFERQGAVRTASSEQVRQPIYRGSIGRWQRFEPWLRPLYEGLASAQL